MWSGLKLYAAPLVLLLEALSVAIMGDGSTPLTIFLRLVFLGIGLTISIHERTFRDRRRRDDCEN